MDLGIDGAVAVGYAMQFCLCDDVDKKKREDATMTCSRHVRLRIYRSFYT